MKQICYVINAALAIGLELLSARRSLEMVNTKYIDVLEKSTGNNILYQFLDKSIFTNEYIKTMIRFLYLVEQRENIDLKLGVGPGSGIHVELFVTLWP